MPVPFKLFRGYRVPVGANEHWMEAAADRSLQPGDLVISSYPKNGTTWLQHIVFLLLGRGRAPRGMMQVIEAMPFPEQDGPCQNSRPLAVKYHLPFRLTPLLEEARFLYVARNPKDTCVSYYHFLKKLPGYHIDSFDEFFDAFLTGEVPYGDHLEHVLEWSEAAALRPNVFFLTYEDLSKNREDAIRRIARFLNIEAQDTFSGKPLNLLCTSTSFWGIKIVHETELLVQIDSSTTERFFNLDGLLFTKTTPTSPSLIKELTIKIILM
ncbi:sulfotransferase 1C4 [Nephila pilipes]|uniref:Sulfotransferase 1C4 n=1 Tax=Nephila pilipes TaxID=299642 RepID=A0A8X6R384_NEPPI|nr:sulfotransferase 1C4 [Nephila pilipes]